MPRFNKGAIANFFGLADEEEYDYPGYTEQIDRKVEVQKPVQSRSTQVKEAVSTPTRSQTRTTQATRQASRPVQRKESVSEEPKVVELRKNTSKSNQSTVERKASKTQLSSKISIMEPRAYSEAMTIAKKIIGGESVLVNFHLIEETQARRIVDFLTGTVYAEDGDIKRVGDEIFLCTPAGIEIDNSTAQTLADANLFDLQF